MAWISGLAGKAENLLNKIDKNTAAVLSKDKYAIESDSQLTDITLISPFDSFASIETIQNMVPESPAKSGRFIRPLNLPETPERFIPPAVRDEELIDFLNTPTKQNDNRLNYLSSTTTPSSLSVENSDNKESEYSSYSGRSSPDFSSTLIEIKNFNENNIEPGDLRAENKILRDEVERLNNELLVAVHVDETIESEQEGIQSKLESIKREYEYKLNQQRQQIEHLMKNSKKNDLKKKQNNTQKHLEEQNIILNRQHTDNQKVIELLKEKLQQKEMSNIQFIKQITDLEGGLERTRMELQSTRQELEQHRARALKTLQEKEKLIIELRNNSSDNNYSETSTSITMELNQLQQECTSLREENQYLCEQLKVLKEELVNADLKIEETCRKHDYAARENQEFLINERRKRIEAEQNEKLQAEEAKKYKNELTLQMNIYTEKFKKQEIEIKRLKTQLSAVSTPTSAVEIRLSTLTQTLVTKQIELEALTTEKNALRLQLERLEQEYRKVLSSLKKPYNVNDTDDAKAQVPTFMVESPFDTTVARRVKRAYSSLDAISVRIGVFLRRYPLARILVIIYIGLLQFWVLVVLLSRTPDAH